jgi:hypothetical protein
MQKAQEVIDRALHPRPLSSDPVARSVQKFIEFRAIATSLIYLNFESILSI